MRNTKIVLAALTALFVVLVMSQLRIVAYAEENETLTLPVTMEEEGYTWSIDVHGVFTIELGENNYVWFDFTNGDDTPWADYQELIHKIVLPEGSVYYSDNMFDGCVNLRQVEIHSMGEEDGRAFYQCPNLESVVIGSEWVMFMEEFLDFFAGKTIYYPSKYSDSFGWYVEWWEEYGINCVAFDENCPHECTIVPGTHPTCTSTGWTEGTECSLCGESVIPERFLPVQHDLAIIAAIEPSCAVEGFTEGTQCTKCGKIVDVPVSLGTLPHTVVVDERVEPTCSETGLTEGSHCSVCDQILVNQEVIQTLPHKLVTDERVNPTCTEDGLTEGSHCSVCGKVNVSQDVLHRLWHSPVVSSFITTFDSISIYKTVCSRCGEDLGIGYKYSLSGRLETLSKRAEGSLNEGKIRWTLFHYYTYSNILLIEGAGEITSIPWYDYIGYIGCVVIEEGITGLPEGAFADCSNLKRVVIPESVTRIPDRAFMGCSELEIDGVLEGRESIGAYAFSGCSSFPERIDIPNSVVNLGERAFADLSKVTIVTLPSSISHIGKDVFEGCIKLNSVIYLGESDSWKNVDVSQQNAVLNAFLSSGIIFQGDRGDIWWAIFDDGNLFITGNGEIPGFENEDDQASFRSYANLVRKISLGEGITAIGDYSFYGFNNVMMVDFPSTLETIGAYSFYGCSSLISVKVPESMRSVGEGAFFSCDSLLEIIDKRSYASWYGAIDQGVGVIDSNYKKNYVGYGGYWRVNKNTLTIEQGEVSIRNLCSQYSFTYEDIITTIRIDAPNGMIDLTELSYYLPNVTQIILTNNPSTIYLESNDQLERITVNPYEATSFFMENDVLYQRINGGVRMVYGLQMSNSATFTMPEYVTEIGAYMFQNWEMLTSVTIPDSVTYIGLGAFENCIRLKKIELPSALSEISPRTFNGCVRLERVNIPQNVNSIGDYAFNGCKRLSSITLPEYLIDIGDYAFSECQLLTSIVYPDSVEAIGKHAFESCLSLTSISIPGSVVRIRDAAFLNCYNLLSVSLTEGLEEIGSEAFKSCSVLQDIQLPEGLKTLGSYAFMSCRSLERIAIPESVEGVIPYGGFMYCNNLREVVITSKMITEIEGYAFYECPLSGTIDIPESVKYIGRYAFDDSRAMIIFHSLDVQLKEDWTDWKYVALPLSVEEWQSEYDLYTMFENLNGAVIHCTDGLISISEYGLNHSEIIAYGDTAYISYRTSFGNEKGMQILAQSGVRKFVLDEGMSELSFNLINYSWSNTLVIPKSVSKLEGSMGWIGCNRIYIMNPDVDLNDIYFFYAQSPRNIYFAGSEEQWKEQGGPYENGVTYHFNYSVLDSGSCGDKLTWQVDSEGVLTIEGAGEMIQYSASNPAPWTQYASQITSIEMGRGITSLTVDAFAGLEDLFIKYYGTIEDYQAIEIVGDESKIDIHTVCSESYDGEHVWDQGIIMDEGTCAANGIKRYTCTACGVQNDVKIPGIGHDYRTLSERPATCTTNGEIYQICRNCGEEHTEILEAKGHVYVIVEAREATCMEEGTTEGKSCSVCGTVWSTARVIPALGHDITTSITLPRPGHSGFTTDNCSRCDYVRIYNYIDSDHPMVQGCSLTLNGEIGLNFYVLFSEGTDLTGAWVVFTQNGMEYDPVSIDEFSRSGLLYKFTIPLSVKEMNDNVSLRIYDKDGNLLTLSRNGVEYSNGYSYSIREYVETAKRNNSVSDALLTLLDNMMNYGAYAQMYFGYRVFTASCNETLISQVDTSIFVRGAASYSAEIDEVTYYGSSLLLEDKTTIRHYFIVNGNVDDLDVTVNGNHSVLTGRGTMYCVDIADITAADLDELYTVTISTGNEVYIIRYSAFSYAKMVLEANTNQKLCNLMKAMAMYNKAAEVYFGR